MWIFGKKKDNFNKDVYSTFNTNETGIKEDVVENLAKEIDGLNFENSNVENGVYSKFTVDNANLNQIENVGKSEYQSFSEFSVGNEAKNSELPEKVTPWTRIRNFFSQEIVIEMTPYQEKVLKEVKDFWCQEISFKKLHDFLFQEIKFK